MKTPDQSSVLCTVFFCDEGRATAASTHCMDTMYLTWKGSKKTVLIHLSFKEGSRGLSIAVAKEKRYLVSAS
jgi:hypothetical protein